jgi:hypothetical protein
MGLRPVAFPAQPRPIRAGVILLRRDRFQMFRVHTALVLAEMIGLEAWGNGSLDQRVEDPMG